MLNLKELNIAIDSLINKKYDRINILQGHLEPYLSFLKKADTNNTFILTIGTSKDTSYSINADSILTNYDNKTLKKAISTTRSIKGFADFADKDMSHKDKLIVNHEVEWHRKFTIAFSCLVFFFMGAPLGAIIRKGGFGYPFIITLLLYVLYHIMIFWI